MNNSILVYKVLTFIPKGKVLTYGGVARLIGTPKGARAVGNILHKNPNAPKVPCHRVVGRDGRMGAGYGLGGPKAQERRLQEEGIETNNGRVNLPQYLWQPTKPLRLYLRLLSLFGDPGHWPWFGNGPAHTSEEIAIGAILTQNTNWKNVEKAIENLRITNACSIRGTYKLGIEDYKKLKVLVRPSGYYNQKTKRLFEFCKFIIKKHKTLKNFLKRKGAREELLALHGIGPETADTILLYAGNKPIFVIDAYTKRFATHYKLTKHLSYDDLQKFFLKNLPEDAGLFQDYHALIVKWGKSSI